VGRIRVVRHRDGSKKYSIQVFVKRWLVSAEDSQDGDSDKEKQINRVVNGSLPALFATLTPAPSGRNRRRSVWAATGEVTEKQVVIQR
jgi:hypothetical protein